MKAHSNKNKVVAGNHKRVQDLEGKKPVSVSQIQSPPIKDFCLIMIKWALDANTFT